MTQAQPDRPSLFLRLLPSRHGRRNSRVRIEGQEKWLTQALGQVLQLEPALCRSLLSSWFDITVGCEVRPRVRTEVEYPLSGPQRTATVDLVVEVPGHVVFVENKLDSPLSIYLNPGGGLPAKLDQVEWYQVALGEHRGQSRGHIAVLGKRRPAGGHRFFSWWDLHRLVAVHLASAAEEESPGRWLAGQFLQFLEEVHLDPPAQLRPGSRFVPRHARRLLTEVAAANALPCARLYGSDSLQLEAVCADGLTRIHRVWFAADGREGTVLRAHRDRIGLLCIPALGHFWSADLAEQQRILLRVLEGVGALKPESGARLTASEALAGHNDAELSARALLVSTRIQTRWDVRPVVGSNTSVHPEVSHAIRDFGTLRLRVTPNRADLIFSVGEAAVPTTRKALARAVGPLASSGNRTQVNVPLRLIQPHLIGSVLEVVDRLRSHENPERTGNADTKADDSPQVAEGARQ